MRPNDMEAKKSWLTRKKLLLIGMVLLVIVGGGLALTLTGNKDTPEQTPQSDGTPHGDSNPSKLDGPAVGGFAYIPACKVFTAVNQQDLFAGLAGSALVEADYADDGLPVADITANGIQSNCSREFGLDSTYANVVMTFSLNQFPSEAAAQKAFEIYGLTQDQLDKANKTFKTTLAVDNEPLPGAPNTQYSPSTKSSHTLYGNKIVAFNADFGTSSLSEATYKQAVVTALPVVERNIDNAKASSTPLNDSSVFGKKIGAATLYNPCALFDGQVFRDASRHHDDPSRITLSYNYNAATFMPTNTEDGYATISCQRYAYPGTTKGVQDIKVELSVFKTADEAATSARQNVTKRTNDSFYKLQAEQVKNIGAYAAYLKPKSGGTLSSYYVQQGPYVLVLNGTTSAAKKGDVSQPTTGDEYTAFAKLLVPKLK